MLKTALAIGFRVKDKIEQMLEMFIFTVLSILTRTYLQLFSAYHEHKHTYAGNHFHFQIFIHECFRQTSLRVKYMFHLMHYLPVYWKIIFIPNH